MTRKTALALRRWLDRTLDRFGDRILDVDRAVAEHWGRVGIPDPLPDVDGLIAATALVHNLVVGTRNVKHIAPAGVRCFNPFERRIMTRSSHLRGVPPRLN